LDSRVSGKENVMKVKVNCTLEIDKKIIETYIDDMGDQESIKEFVVRYIVTGGVMCLDESIRNAIGEQHQTSIVKWDLGRGAE
jgi:hypothetical protein